MMDTSIMLLILTGLAVSILFYVKWVLGYWKRKGFHSVQPMFTGDPSEYITNSYNAFKKQGAKIGGIYIFFHPILLPVDLNILKNIMQKDFSHFVNRDVYCNEKVEPLMANLFSLKDNAWKNVRTQLTPVFSAAKMKMMFPIFVDTTTELIETLKETVSKNEPLEAKEFFERYTTDILASCAFGIDCNSLKNPNSEFLKIGRMVIKSMNFRIAIMFLIPYRILHFFRARLTPKPTEDFFKSTVQNTMHFRKENKIQRTDLFQSLMQLKSQDPGASYNNNVSNETRIQQKHLNKIAAECLVCYTAGYETSSTTMAMALLELSLNRNIQIKLRNEINHCLKDFNGNITYDAVVKMEYMDQVVNETLRKYTPARFMFRACNEDYMIPGSDLWIKKGTKIILPYDSIHHDSQYYPEPDKFYPERFSNENRANIPNFAFLPFGDGPRVCIAYRFGLLQVKVGIAAILKNFEVTLNKKTEQPIKFTKGLLPIVKGGIWINFRQIESAQKENSK